MRTSGVVASIPTAADLRAEIARRRIRLYHLAPVVELHPSRLSVLLSGRVDIPADVALRIRRAVENWGGGSA